MSSNSQIVSIGLWQWLQRVGLERFELARTEQDWKLRGTILATSEIGPVEARYEITCNTFFHTQLARISVLDSAGERSLEISVQKGLWLVNGRENTSVRGALDIDLGWSPSTNTLPIRRLNLAVGERSGEFIAAWVRFPDLTLEPLPQEYTRLSERVYRYSSRGGAFTAELTVDDHSLVENYEGIWRRVNSRVFHN